MASGAPASAGAFCGTFVTPTEKEPNRRGPVVLMLSETLDVLAQTAACARPGRHCRAAHLR